MKKLTSTLSTLAIAAFFAFTVTSFTGCKQEGCTDVTANNYDEKADEDDGSCTYDRDLFLGTYSNIIETCNPGSPSSPYSITISASGSNTVSVNISNFANTDVTVVGSISGTSLVIATQTFTDSFGTFSLTANGSISASGTSLTIAYSYSQDGVVSNCSFTATKS